MIHRSAMLLGLFLASQASAAEVKICVVDAERAINETSEGKDAQAKLETMYSSKQTELERMQKDFEQEVKDFESRIPILSESAAAEQEQVLLQKRQELQMRVVQAEQEMQQTYMALLGGMEEKLVVAAEQLGAKKGCTVLLQKAAVMFVGEGVIDLTAPLIAEYDSTQH